MKFPRISILTIFPNAFPGALGVGLIGKSSTHMEVIDLKQYKSKRNNHYYLDDKPFGETTGMVLCPSVVERAIQSFDLTKCKLIYPSPRGIPFTYEVAERLSKQEHLVFLCGRYEGVDQRAIDHYEFEEISLGDFILCGGEVATMAMCEAIIRLHDNTLSNPDSVRDESFYNDILEHNHYTECREWKGYLVPEVLLKGNHHEINLWKLNSAIQNTQKTRPDLALKFKQKCLIFVLFILMTPKIMKKIQKLNRRIQSIK